MQIEKALIRQKEIRKIFCENAIRLQNVDRDEWLRTEEKQKNLEKMW